MTSYHLYASFHYSRFNLGNFYTSIKQIDELPVTINGKLDKKALPEIAIESTKEFCAPETEIEKIMCAIFEKQVMKQLLTFQCGM